MGLWLTVAVDLVPEGDSKDSDGKGSEEGCCGRDVEELIDEWRNGGVR